MDYTFERPHRPLLVKIVNSTVRRRPPRHGSKQEIVTTAARRRGPSAWDDHSFMEPLEVLVRSYREEANLTPAGILMIGGAPLTQATNSGIG